MKTSATYKLIELLRELSLGFIFISVMVNSPLSPWKISLSLIYLITSFDVIPKCKLMFSIITVFELAIFLSSSSVVAD
jgi:hypothetical protein